MVSGLRDRRWLIRLVMAAWIGTSLLAAFLLYQLNGIVHGTLYNYGLQFNESWAVPYWDYERLLYVCLYAPSFVGGAVLVFDLWRSRSEKPLIVRQVNTVVPRAGVAAPSNIVFRERSAKVKCPECKRILSRYLNMLDYSSGKPRMVDVCPYCNHVLAPSEDTNGNGDVRVLEPERHVLKKKGRN